MKGRVALLLALAVAQMVGDAVRSPVLRGMAAATAASPAPRVFSAVRGLETYSTRFGIGWRDARGEEHRLELTPATAARLRGPYNRRNVFGAALAYGPVLANDVRTARMLEQVLKYALCPPSPVLRELAGDSVDASGGVWIDYEPLRPESLEGLPTHIDAPCSGAR
jgi:hypothetical protein